MDNAISVDLEEWYQFGHADIQTQKKRKSLSQTRVINNTRRLLEIFGAYNVRATFFVLGSIAEEFPDLIKEVSLKGHEIASHGYEHTSVHDLDQKGFMADVQKSQEVLGKITGKKILGYRAPYLSLTGQVWAFEVLASLGFLYDSSLKSHFCAGLPGEKKQYYYEIITKEKKKILEFPISGIKIINFNLYFSGGTYFRMIPENFIKQAIKYLNQQGKIVNLYLHPRDIDTTLPKLKLSYMDNIRYSGRTGNTEKKIRHILENFSFAPIASFFNP